MDSITLFKYETDKPFLILKLDISGKIMNWLIPKPSPVKKSIKRLAVEMPDSTAGTKGLKKTVLLDKCEININYQGKRKIVFAFARENADINEIVLLIPSWGLRTEKKIWVLIPV